MSRFDECMEFIGKWEGGKVDDPLDRGGRTAFGVTQRSYDAHRRDLGLAPKDVWEITPQEVKDIYFRHYWTPCGCGSLPEPLDLVVFDSAVNCGGRRAVKWLQLAVGMAPGEIDGVFGPHTLLHVSDAAASGDIPRTVVRYMEEREQHYYNLAEKDPSQSRFLKGWMNRLAALNTQTGVA